MIVLQIASPKPVPLFLVVNKGSKIFGNTDFVIPGPSSSISIFTESSSSYSLTSISPSSPTA